jgi:glycine/D-amino acid oxidase-like deaminating enzyme
MADRVVLATGAWSPSLVDLKGQCVSKVTFACGSAFLLSWITNTHPRRRLGFWRISNSIRMKLRCTEECL